MEIMLLLTLYMCMNYRTASGGDTKSGPVVCGTADGNCLILCILKAHKEQSCNLALVPPLMNLTN